VRADRHEWLATARASAVKSRARDILSLSAPEELSHPRFGAATAFTHRPAHRTYCAP
jgi:hypothetical protein